MNMLQLSSELLPRLGCVQFALQASLFGFGCRRRLSAFSDESRGGGRLHLDLCEPLGYLGTTIHLRRFCRAIRRFIICCLRRIGRGGVWF